MAYLKRTGISVVSEVLAGVLVFAYALLLARLLSLHDFGLFQAALGAFGLLSIPAVPFHLISLDSVRQAGGISQGRPGILRLTRTTIALYGAALILWISGYAAAGRLSPDFYCWWTAGLTAAAAVILRILIGAWQAELRFFALAGLRVFQAVITVAAGFLMVKAGTGATGAVAGYGLAAALAALVIFPYKRKLSSLETAPPVSPEEKRTALRITGVLAFVFCVEHLPVIAAKARFDAETSAAFGALYNLRQVIWPFAFSIAYSFYAHYHSGEERKALTKKTLVMITVLGALFALAACAAPQTILTLLYGSSYAAAAQWMPLYALSLYLQMLAIIILFQALAERRKIGFILMIGSALFIVWILWPGSSPLGMITAQILSTACVLLLMRILPEKKASL